MNRLTPITPTNARKSGLRIVLEHLQDSHPDEYETALGMLANHRYGHTDIADALNLIARDDNLGVRVTEKSIRDHRKAQI